MVNDLIIRKKAMAYFFHNTIVQSDNIFNS